MPMTSISLCDLNTKGITTLNSVERCTHKRLYRVHGWCTWARKEKRKKKSTTNSIVNIKRYWKDSKNDNGWKTGEKWNECDQHLYSGVCAMKSTVINGHGTTVQNVHWALSIYCKMIVYEYVLVHLGIPAAQWNVTVNWAQIKIYNTLARSLRWMWTPIGSW